MRTAILVCVLFAVLGLSAARTQYLISTTFSGPSCNSTAASASVFVTGRCFYNGQQWVRPSCENGKAYQRTYNLKDCKGAHKNNDKNLGCAQGSSGSFVNTSCSYDFPTLLNSSSVTVTFYGPPSEGCKPKSLINFQISFNDTQKICTRKPVLCGNGALTNTSAAKVCSPDFHLNSYLPPTPISSSRISTAASVSTNSRNSTRTSSLSSTSSKTSSSAPKTSSSSSSSSSSTRPTSTRTSTRRPTRTNKPSKTVIIPTSIPKNSTATSTITQSSGNSTYTVTNSGNIIVSSKNGALLLAPFFALSVALFAFLL